MTAPFLPRPVLCLVTDRTLTGIDYLVETVAEAVSGGVNVVQLREKDLSGGPLLDLAIGLKRITQGRALLFVNERLDVALASGADGVHLGETAISTAAARQLTGQRLLIGRSVHSVQGGLTALQDGTDYLIAGAVYSTRSHPAAAPTGVELIESLTAKTAAPVLGIGGIGPSNACQVIEAGASGVAVISAILSSPKPKDASRELWERISRSWHLQPAARRTSSR